MSPNRTSPRARVWGMAAAIALGVLVGLGLFTFDYAEGTSYFSSDPEACVNCHIMRQQFDAWNHSSHKAVAACNDCHTPHTFPGKWIVKGINGFNHSAAFTLGNFDEPIEIRAFNERVAVDNCVECHATTVSQMHTNAEGEELSCLACHKNVGHND